MCESEIAFTAAYVPWQPAVDLVATAGRLSTPHHDYEMNSRLRADGYRSCPSKREEEEAVAVLAPFMTDIEQRFGLSPVLARYVLCTASTASGKPMTALAKAMVREFDVRHRA